MGAPRILVVEDEQIVALNLTSTLRQLGYEVADTTDSGEAAIELVQHASADLVLMDVALRGDMDGLAAAHEISKSRRIPTVLLTAYCNDEMLARAKENGVSGYLTKPFRIHDLNAAIVLALNQHRTFQHVLREKALLTTVLASISDGVIAIDAEGRVAFLNARAETLTGWTQDRALGRPIQEVYSTHAEPNAITGENRFRLALRHGAAVTYDRFVLSSTNCHDCAIEETVAPLYEEDRITGAVVVFRDIRERLKLQEAEKLKSIGLLAGGVAHDFNNLLTAIIGNASLAADGLPPLSSVRPLLQNVLTTATRAAELAQQLLAYAGKGQFVVSEVDLTEAVREMLALLRPSVPDNVSISLRLSEGLPSIHADRSQIQQIIMNLVINAAEAMSAKGGVIEITTGKHEEFRPQGSERNSLCVFLSVRDSGAGMNRETMTKIFDPFFTTKFMGRGLGLSAVQGIVRSHGGTVHVESTPGSGTTFTVILPAHEVPRDPLEAAEAAGRLQGEGVILVIDDLETVRDVARRALEKFGYTVLIADSGPAALDIVNRSGEKMDLVLLDLSMPAMTGEETGKRIQELQPDVPICVMTGFTEIGARERLSSLGPIAGFLKKPFTPEHIARTVKGILEARRDPAEERG